MVGDYLLLCLRTNPGGKLANVLVSVQLMSIKLTNCTSVTQLDEQNCCIA